jgi:predicted CopG family antitoxin
MRETTVIKIGKDVKKELEALKVHPRETYEDVIRRLIQAWNVKSK